MKKNDHISHFLAVLAICFSMLAGCAPQPVSPPDSRQASGRAEPGDVAFPEQAADGIMIEQEMWDVLAVVEGKIFYASPGVDIPVLWLHCYDVETGADQELLRIENVMRWSGDCVTAGDALYMVISDASTEECSPMGEIVGVENRVVRIDCKEPSAEIYDTYRSVDAITQLVPVNDAEFMMTYTTGSDTQLTNSIARYTIADKKSTPIVSKQMARADAGSPWSSWANRQSNSTVSGEKIFSFCVDDKLIYSVEATVHAIGAGSAEVNDYAVYVYEQTGKQLKTYDLNKMKELTSMDTQNHNFFKRIYAIGGTVIVEDYASRTTFLQLDPEGAGYTSSMVERMYGLYDISPDPIYAMLDGEDGLMVIDHGGTVKMYRPKEPDTSYDSVVFHQKEAVITYINEKTGEIKTVYYQDINNAFAQWEMVG